jgi:hypothetical protein
MNKEEHQTSNCPYRDDEHTFGCTACIPQTQSRMNKEEQFYKAWWYLVDNYEWVIKNLDIDVIKVNPKTEEVDDDPEKNTLIEIWLETGPDEKNEHGVPCATYDPNLDCGGNTFEEAIIKLSKLVKKYYEN